MPTEGQLRLAPILLVDDEVNDVWLMRRAFECAQIQNPLLVANDGEEAIELLRSLDGDLPCLLITDLKMPKADGFDLLHWLQTQPQFSRMPKIVISSSVLEEDLAKSLQHGATAYFVKPSSHSDLIELVRKWKEKFL